MWPRVPLSRIAKVFQQTHDIWLVHSYHFYDVLIFFKSKSLSHTMVNVDNIRMFTVRYSLFFPRQFIMSNVPKSEMAKHWTLYIVTTNLLVNNNNNFVNCSCVTKSETKTFECCVRRTVAFRMNTYIYIWTYTRVRGAWMWYMTKSIRI